MAVAGGVAAAITALGTVAKVGLDEKQRKRAERKSEEVEARGEVAERQLKHEKAEFEADREKDETRDAQAKRKRRFESKGAGKRRTILTGPRGRGERRAPAFLDELEEDGLIGRSLLG